MKLNKSIMALATAAAFGISGQAFAEGTLAGTSIDNTVTLGYTVNSVAQDDLTQNTAFLVDTKVDFALSDVETATVKVTPNGNNYVATFLLSSDSNDTLDFDLSTSDLANGTQSFLAPLTVEDNFQLDANLSIFVEDGTTPGYQSAEDTATSVDDLAAEDTVNVYVVVTTAIDAAQADKDIAAIELTATALQSSGAAIPDNGSDAFIQGTKQYVIAEAGLDGIDTLNVAFEVGTAKFTDPDDLSVTPAKFTLDVIVINDPMCDTGLTSTSTADHSAGGTCPDAAATYIPKAIPGAMVEYTLKAKNSGSINATAVEFSEDLSTIGDIDGDLTEDLVQNSLDNVAVTFTGAGADTDNSTSNVLEIDVDTFAVDDEITITFTAIVE